MFDDFYAPQVKERDSRRTFTQSQKNQIWDQQNGKCAHCKKRLERSYVQYDHKKGWAASGRTITVNGQALCANCHGKKTNSDRVKQVEKKKKSTKQSPTSVTLFGQAPSRKTTRIDPMETIFGSPKKSKKQQDPFASMFGPPPKRKGKQPKGPFGF